jgi:hypothetical protein
MKGRTLEILYFALGIGFLIIMNCMPIYSGAAVKHKDCMQVKSELPAVLQKGFCDDSVKSKS